MKKYSAQEIRPYVIPIIIVCALAAGLTAGGYYYYSRQKEDYTRHVEKTLDVIANLQTSEIAGWRKARIGDAIHRFQSDIFFEVYSRYQQERFNPVRRQSFTKWLTNFQQYYEYDRISIFDINEKEIYAVPETSAVSASVVREQVHDVLAKNDLLFIDFYRHDKNDKVYITILVPIKHSRTHDAIGVAAIRIDLDKDFFKIINNFPTSYRSIETLIFRRDGDEIVYLNEMRLISQSPLSYRVPMTRTELPAVQAVLGKEGNISGLDYRGIPVIASVRKIPNSPWYIVVKIDNAEVEEPMSERFWMLIFLVSGLIIGGGSVIASLLRTLHVSLLKENLKTIKQQQFLQEIIRNSLNEIYLLNTQTLRFTFVNDVACKNLQYSIEEMKTLTTFDVNTGFTREEFLDLIKPLVHNNQEVLLFESFHRRKDGSMYPVEIHFQWMETSDGPTFVEFVSNITERKQAELSLRKTNEYLLKSEEKIRKAMNELERSNKELEQFAYVASHDLQEPLRMVASYTQLLAHRYKDKLDSDANEFIQFAVDGANRMQRLINDLLDYSRISTRGDGFVTIDTNAILGEVIVNLHHRIQERGAVVTNSELPIITGDRSQMFRLFQNLLDNAMKFGKNGDLPAVHISAIERDSEFEFLVKDNGIGIDKAYQERIFIIFQRLHTKEEYSGSGIGLSICKRIVERHQGRIWCESTPGSGTTFHFTIQKNLSNESV